MFHWPIDFKTLEKPSSPNFAIACPNSWCNIQPDIVSRTFSVSVQQLQAAWQVVITKEPRFKQLKQQGYQQLYVQRSRVWRFPDYIAVEFIALDPDHSTIAMVSQSKYGYYDFGVNLARLKRLYVQLAKTIKVSSDQAS